MYKTVWMKYRLVIEKALCQGPNQRHLGKLANPPIVAVLFAHVMWVAEVEHNHNSNPRNDNSHHNMGHCSRLDNPHNRNSRNHNL